VPNTTVSATDYNEYEAGQYSRNPTVEYTQSQPHVQPPEISA
jgi:hypothetical protein